MFYHDKLESLNVELQYKTFIHIFLLFHHAIDWPTVAALLLLQNSKKNCEKKFQNTFIYYFVYETSKFQVNYLQNI